MHNYEDAIKAFNLSIDLKPDFFWSRLNRAKALVAIGQNRNAAEDFQYLLKRDPNNQELIQSLSVLIDRVPNSEVQAITTRPSDQNSIKMVQEGGVYVVPVRFNNMITLGAVVDSGASDVSIPADVVSTLVRTKTITEDDFLGQQTYILADGSKVPSQRFRIRSLKVGDRLLENVVASIASVNGEILLGQSFLSRFKSWSFDNEQHTLNLR